MRISDDFRKSVVFFGLPRQEADGTESVRYRGTGFFVTIHDDELNYGFTYLVTAAHVADGIAGRKSCIRMNSNNGQSSVSLELDGSERWFRHPTDGSVDAAVLPYAPPPEANIDWSTTSAKVFATQENMSPCNLSIGAGDEVYVVGLFTRHFGKARNIPIVRTGNIAMMPEERVHNKDFGDMEVYLIESRSIGGLSGSTVFVRSSESRGGRIIFDRNIVSLLGLVHGHRDVSPEARESFFGEDGATSAMINSGIAIVVPAEKILDVLDHPELKEQRDQKLAEVRGQSGGKVS